MYDVVKEQLTQFICKFSYSNTSTKPRIMIKDSFIIFPSRIYLCSHRFFSQSWIIFAQTLSKFIEISNNVLFLTYCITSIERAGNANSISQSSFDALWYYKS